MAKTLRVRQAQGWVTKDPEDLPANRLTAEEIDDNFLALHEQIRWMRGFKNAVINGNFHMWQRGTGPSSGTGYQSADRFVVSSSNNVPVLRRANIDPDAISGSRSLYTLRINTTADAGASDYQIVSHRIESVRTFSGQKAVLSFWTYCTTSLHIAVNFRQYFGTGGSPSAIVDFNGDIKKVPVNAQWQKHTIVVDLPSISGKSIGTDGNDYLQIMFWFSAGSDHNTSTDALGHQTGQFYIADIQFERGDIATDFEDRPLSIEAMLCYRYYWRITPGQFNFQGYANNAIMSWRLGPGIPMRTTPTASSDLSGVTATRCNTPIWVNTGSNENNGGLLYTTANQITINAFFTCGANDYIALSAEL